MKNVVIRGPVMTQSGYGVHSRQFVKYAMKRDDWNVSFQITPWGLTPWLVDINDPIIKFITKNSTPNQHNDLSIQIQLPNEWDPNLAKKNIGVTAAVETTNCNPVWVTCCNAMDSVIFPSKFTKKVVEDTGHLTVNSYVVNEAFPEEFTENTCTIDLDIETKFNFLVYGQVTGTNAELDRKNFFYTIRWLCELFKDDKDVGIVVKTNSGRNSIIDKKITSSLMENILKQVKKDKFPKIHLLHGNLSNEEVGGLYRHEKIKCIVSATRGEGYGLPLLEAAALDLPVIATNWSGHLDFLNLGRFIPLDYDLVTIPEQKVDNQIFMTGSKWAQVKEEDFKRKVKKFRNSYKTPQEWSNSLGKVIRNKFSQNAIEKKMEEVFSETLA